MVVREGDAEKYVLMAGGAKGKNLTALTLGEDNNKNWKRILGPLFLMLLR